MNEHEISDAQHESSPEPAKRGGHGSKILIVVLVLAVVVLAVAYVKAQQDLSYLQSEAGSGAQAQAEVQAVVEGASKHMLLSDAEMPTVATIVDAEALAEQQAFYKDAVNGDQVLIYQQSQQAVIYSPSRDIIVNVGPIVFGDGQQQVGEVSTTTPPEQELADQEPEDPLAVAPEESEGE